MIAQSVTQWHFSRPKLAQAYVDSFNLGLSSARGLFARRRMGKTEFLVQDFIPAAQSQNYQCAYVNLWELKNDPATALVCAFYKAVEPAGFAKLWGQLTTPVSRLKASAKFVGLAEAGVEADLETKNKLSGTLLMQAMAQFDKTSERLVLIIDEAQVLASANNSTFAHALRSALDIRRERLKVLFAGSSETTLRRMFGRASEPFYNWAALEPFPLLGREFVEAMVDKVAQLSRAPLSLPDAMAAFDDLKQTPLFFREYLDRYLTHPFEGSQRALEVVKAKVFNDEGFEKQWQSLSPADQLLLSQIACGATDLHGKEMRERVGLQLGLDAPVTAASMQNSLRRLVDKAIVTRMERGEYRLEDELFGQWLQDAM